MYDKRIFAHNLKYYMERERLNQKDIARIVDASESAVSAWTRAVKTPRMDKVARLARLFGCEIHDLIEERSPSFSTRRVPRVGTIACGSPISAEQSYEGFDAVPEYIDCDYTLVCKGDSMTRARICDGDIVCVKATNTAQEGQIVVVSIEGAGDGWEATLKRIHYTNGAILLCPDSNNPEYVPLLITQDRVNEVHIQGVATYFISAIH